MILIKKTYMHDGIMMHDNPESDIKFEDISGEIQRIEAKLKKEKKYFGEFYKQFNLKHNS